MSGAFPKGQRAGGLPKNQRPDIFERGGAMERDSEWVANKRGGFAETWRANHDRGCEIIARGLRDEMVPVF
jgi:hypothetical protein